MAAAPDLGSGAERRGGSSPFIRTEIWVFVYSSQLLEDLPTNQQLTTSNWVRTI